MIVVDTSALIAIVFDEQKAEVCSKALETETEILISAGTLAESLIVARRRGETEELSGSSTISGSRLSASRRRRRGVLRKPRGDGARASTRLA
jgi:ribonuclease VapC